MPEECVGHFKLINTRSEADAKENILTLHKKKVYLICRLILIIK